MFNYCCIKQFPGNYHYSLPQTIDTTSHLRPIWSLFPIPVQWQPHHIFWAWISGRRVPVFPRVRMRFWDAWRVNDDVTGESPIHRSDHHSGVSIWPEWWRVVLIIKRHGNYVNEGEILMDPFLIPPWMTSRKRHSKSCGQVSVQQIVS